MHHGQHVRDLHHLLPAQCLRQCCVLESMWHHRLRISLHLETASIMAGGKRSWKPLGRIDPLAHTGAGASRHCRRRSLSRAAILADGLVRAFTSCIYLPARSCALWQKQSAVASISLAKPAPLSATRLDRYERLGSIIRVNPPVREPHEPRGDLEGLLSGVIDMTPPIMRASTEEKIRNRIWDADCGFPAWKRRLPLMLTQVAQAAVA